MVATLKNQLENLTLQLDEYLKSKITADELEQYTMGIIAHDDFDKLDDNLQDVIYTLDNRELNELTKSDIKEIEKRLKDTLGLDKKSDLS